MDEAPQHHLSTRPGVGSDLDWVHRQLMHAIDNSPFYNDIFKAWEKQRMTRSFIQDLFELDPWFVLIMEVDGERAGFQISGPDCGALFLYWSYVLEEYRRSGIAVYSMRRYVERFDDGNYHKLTTLTRTNNRAAIVIMNRFGWHEVARLENHIFGEDYLQYEYPLTKTRPGYRVMHSGRRASLIRRVRRVLQLG